MKILNISQIFRRELGAYFNAPIAYIFIIVFSLISTALYMTQFFLMNRADMRPFFATLPFLICVFLPAVSMRLWAEERRGNTLEMLLTFPMKTSELVTGKFFASLVFYFAALAATFTVPVMLMILGRPDLGGIAGGYTGAFLMGAFFLSIGIFISGFCRDQIVAFICTLMICFGLFLLGTEFFATSLDGWIPGLGSFFRFFLGAEPHYQSFARGVVDIRDALYFISGAIIFLTLNVFWLEGRMRPKATAFFSGAAVICSFIFLFGNWFLSDIPLGRFDLTQGQMYTVSPATKKILRELKAPALVKFYISPVEKMPTEMKTLEQDVVGKLEELKIASKGKLGFKVFHMEASNIIPSEGASAEKGKESLEQQISKKGIQPFQVQSIESDEVGVKLVYSALSIAYKEKSEDLIPRIIPDMVDQLEYMLVSKIYRMTLPQPPIIAMVAPYEEKNVDPQVKALFAQMGASLPNGYRDDEFEIASAALAYEGYPVKRIRLNEEEKIPQDAKTLVVLEPQELTSRQQYEISRFLVEGGSVFLAVQNYDFQYEPRPRQFTIRPEEKDPNVNSFLSEWGISVSDTILADSQNEVISVNGSSNSLFQMSVPVKLPIQIILTPKEMNPKVSITSRLSTLFYIWGTALKVDANKIKEKKLSVQTLLTSSPESWDIPFQSVPFNAEALNPQQQSAYGPFPLAILVEGQFTDPFSGKAVPAWEEKPMQPESPESALLEKPKQELDIIPINPKPGKLILVGNAMMFKRQLAQGGGHLNFLLNSVDNLTLGDELVSIRSKQPVDRSLSKISPAQKVFWRFVVILLIPIILAALGTLRMILRSRTKQKYIASLHASA